MIEGYYSLTGNNSAAVCMCNGATTDGAKNTVVYTEILSPNYKPYTTTHHPCVRRPRAHAHEAASQVKVCNNADSAI